MLPITPRGFKDVLPKEARIREELGKRVMGVMDLWGYDPIETPSLEVLDVLEQGSTLDSSTFKLFDGDNNLLVMRPDVTLPIARMVASRLASSGSTTQRFRYNLPVFRENEPSKGQSREFTQLGIEQIGVTGPAFDAETIVVFVECLRSAGLGDFTIEFCNVEVLESLLASCEADASFVQEVKEAYHASNQVRLDAILDASGIDDELRAMLRGLIRIHGGREAIASCRELLGGRVRGEVFDELEATWDIVESCGYADFVGIDFSLLGSFDYYTGLIMEAFAPGFGKPIGSGGRYDGLLQVFGAEAPAAGFAFSLERLMHALAKQGSLDAPERATEVIGSCDADAFAQAMELHAQGRAARIGGGCQ
ncbi:MAG: ATP phosphoribosyltransferase regulatory subunit [Coriobacteriales bacterium]|jgi:ATP phosphoribosyltransferase